MYMYVCMSKEKINEKFSSYLPQTSNSVIQGFRNTNYPISSHRSLLQSPENIRKSLVF